MSLFAELDHEPLPRARRGRRAGWSILGVGVALAVLLALLPAPYVIERPGPVTDTLGTVRIGEEDVPVIEVPDQPTFPTEGSLDLLTVSISGNRQQPPNWVDVLSAWLAPSEAVVPVDEIYPEGISQEESAERSRVDMQNSQQQAVAAALTELGYAFENTLTVVQAQEGMPAEGVLEADDRILSVNGESFDDVTELQRAIGENGTNRPASVTVLRDGQERTVEITPVLSEGDDPAPVIGILVGGDYEFPFEVTIQLENVGGPSAGMMFALGIVDKLTPGAMTGGERIAGTGTITAGGEVGPIGGIRQKLYGALDAGADWFLAPAQNCDEVVGHVPDGLRVFSVATLDDSLAAIDAIAHDGDLDALPVCDAG